MSKYQETSVQNAEYQRCFRITINNPYQQLPSVQFDEECVIKRADGSIIHDNMSSRMMNLNKVISNMNDTLRVYNPLTQQRVGTTVKYSDVYVMIWSAYMEEALRRDANVASQAIIMASQTWCSNRRIQLQNDIQAANAAFQAEDAADRDAAQALADSKETPEEKQVVWAEYNAARAVKEAALQATITQLNSDCQAEIATHEATANTEAQAAFDAIFNG